MTLSIKSPKNSLNKQEALKEIRTEEMDTITIRIPYSLKNNIKIKAIRQKTNITNIIVDYLKEYVK